MIDDGSDHAECETIAKELEERAASYDRLAAMEDTEHPEPDEFCAAAGGDSSRITATLMRRAAALSRRLADDRPVADEGIARLIAKWRGEAAQGRSSLRTLNYAGSGYSAASATILRAERDADELEAFWRGVRDGRREP